MEIVGLVILVFLVSLGGVALVRLLALRFGWVAMPRADRWHTTPVPLYGGVGFIPVLLAGSAWLMGAAYGMPSFTPAEPASGGSVAALGWAWVTGTTAMFGLGWLDDRYHLRPSVKLLVQLFAAGVFILQDGIVHVSDLMIVNVIVTVLWLIGITNALNLIDNMDGLSSSVAAIAGASIALMGALCGGWGPPAMPAFPLASLLTASAVAFWCFNRAPASIYMGDTGSLALGYGLATLSIPTALNGWWSVTGYSHTMQVFLLMAIPLSLLIVPIADTVFVSIARLRAGKSVMEGGRDHTSHRLANRGLSEPSVVHLMNGLGIMGGAVGLLLLWQPRGIVPLACLILLGVFGMMVYLAAVGIEPSVVLSSSSPWKKLCKRLLPFLFVLIYPVDVLLAGLSLYMATLPIELNEASWWNEPEVARIAPLMVFLVLVANKLSGIYRINWRFISLFDFLPFILAGVLATSMLTMILESIPLFVQPFAAIVYITFGVFYTVFLVGTRLALPLLRTFLRHKVTKQLFSPSRGGLLIYGVGTNGFYLLEMIQDLELGKQLIGFVDDDPNYEHMRKHGYEVKSPQRWLTSLSGPISEVWMASSHTTLEQVNEFVRQLAQHPRFPSNPRIRRLKTVLEIVGPSNPMEPKLPLQIKSLELSSAPTYGWGDLAKAGEPSVIRSTSERG